MYTVQGCHNNYHHSIISDCLASYDEAVARFYEYVPMGPIWLELVDPDGQVLFNYAFEYQTKREVASNA